MKKKMLIYGVLGLIVLGCIGCITATDPVTGEQMMGVDPNIATAIESGAQATIGILAILGTLWPVLIPIGTGIGGALVTWRKVKPKLTEAQSEATMYHSATESVVTALEDFKEKYPEGWDKLKAEFTHTIGSNTENIIRAIRGLPPKE